MTKIKKKVNKKKIIAIILLLIIGGVFISKKLNPPKEVITLQSEEVKRRTIANSISATGTITANSSKTITSSLQGVEIKTVNVSEGDYVKKGDIICEFDVSSIKENIKTLEDNIKDLEEQKNSSKNNTTKPNISLSELQSQINETQKEYDSAKNLYEEKDKALKELYYPDNYEEVVNKYEQKYEDYSSASAAYYDKQEIFNSKKELYELYFDGENQLDDEGNIIKKEDYKLEKYATVNHKNIYEEYKEAKDELEKAKKDLETKEKAFNDYEDTYNNMCEEVNNIEQTKSTLESEKNQAKNNMELKKSKLDLLKTTLETTKNTQSNINAITDSFSNIGDMSTTIDSNIKTLESQKKTLEEQVNKSVIKAPIDGIVTTVNTTDGSTYMGGSIVKIEDNEGFSIEAFIDEYDIPDVKEGMKVLIKTDATRDEELTGEVFDIAKTPSSTQTPSLTSNSGNTSYKIKIKIDNNNDRLRLGMNARLSIITNMLENVITVPYTSIHEEDNEDPLTTPKKYIEITKDNETSTKVYIETGIEGNYYVEVTSDNVKEGMKVVIPEIEKDLSIDDLINQMGNAGGLK